MVEFLNEHGNASHGYLLSGQTCFTQLTINFLCFLLRQLIGYDSILLRRLNESKARLLLWMEVFDNTT